MCSQGEVPTINCEQEKKLTTNLNEVKKNDLIYTLSCKSLEKKIQNTIIKTCRGNKV